MAKRTSKFPHKYTWVAKKQKKHFKADISCISLANNRLMDVTKLVLTWVGWPNGEKLALTCVQIWSRPKWAQVIASQRKCMQGLAKRSRKYIYLRVRLARALNHFDIVSGTPYSCDAVGCELWRVVLCSLLCPETDWKICIGKQGYVFILSDFKSDVFMFHSWHESVCHQLLWDWEKFKF